MRRALRAATWLGPSLLWICLALYWLPRRSGRGATGTKLLSEARAAQTMPWDGQRAVLYRTIFPQMTNWLPAAEGAQLRFEFETELAQLEAA
jgi:hypothetical protein